MDALELHWRRYFQAAVVGPSLTAVTITQVHSQCSTLQGNYSSQQNSDHEIAADRLQGSITTPIKHPLPLAFYTL